MSVGAVTARMRVVSGNKRLKEIWRAEFLKKIEQLDAGIQADDNEMGQLEQELEAELDRSHKAEASRVRTVKASSSPKRRAKSSEVGKVTTATTTSPTATTREPFKTTRSKERNHKRAKKKK